MDYRGNQPKSTRELTEWLAREEAVAAIEPDLPIVDAHHHLFGSVEDKQYYRLDDLRQDADCGHRFIGTVYVEGYEAGWRRTGPEALRPVGEVERIVGLTDKPLKTASGDCQVAAGVVCHVDLTRGEQAAEVMHAQHMASRGRLRGVRQRAATVEGPVGRVNSSPPKLHLLSDPQFRRGFAQLDAFGLSFDAWVFHPQLGELIELVDAFPNTPIIVNHVAGPIGVGEFRSQHAEVLREWKEGVVALAARPNVHMKVGGMGMAVYGFGFEQQDRPATAAELVQAWKPYIETCVDAFGTQRCMFESNFPVDKQSSSYCELWNAFKLVTRGWSQDERSDLFYRTACRVYRLTELAQIGEDLTQVCQ